MSDHRAPLLITLCMVGCILLQSCGGSRSTPNSLQHGANRVIEVADRYYVETLLRQPEIAYFSGVPLKHHHGLEDVSPAAIAAAAQAVDSMLRDLETVDADSLIATPEWITYAYLLQALQSSVDLRVCRRELWNVNQMEGWHSLYGQIAKLQPIGTSLFRKESVARWSKFAGRIDQEIRNLEHGLELGYSAPKTVVQRVIDQLNGLLELSVEQSPFYSPARRDTDSAFVDATHTIVADQINPALRRYRNFLANNYLTAARENLSVTANPDGLACYHASLRFYTTLDRSPQDVFKLGEKTVAANTARVIELGSVAYGLDNFAEIMARVRSDKTDHFSSKEDMLQFSRDSVRRAELVMPEWVRTMPEQPVVVEPFPEHEEGTGRSAHYLPGAAGRPGEYRIPLFEPQKQSRGNDEVTAFHETWPGHHLQVAFSQSTAGAHMVSKIIWFSGPGEGWARYSEALAEEMGLYETDTGPILRRAWPARGMVVDPGIHLFGWSREQAIAYMEESGRIAGAQGEQMVDRIAIQPGQLTAYDSGGLEILALRQLAENALGDNFEVRDFHDRILENGTIPLAQLRAHIEAWIAELAADNR